MNQLLAFRNNTMLALDTIRAHKTRSLLTMLGVVIIDDVVYQLLKPKKCWM